MRANKLTSGEGPMRSAMGENRAPLVDALRGFALFGVVTSNMLVMLGAGQRSGPPSVLEETVDQIISYVITGKFLALFSLLFGVSFGLWLRRSSEEGRAVAGLYLRRMAALLLIGAVHRALSGTDILMTYAILGAVLLLFRGAPDRILLVAAVLALGLPELWRAVAEWIGYQAPPPIVTRAERARLAAEGPYLELVRVRTLMLPQFWHGIASQSSIYLTLFLLGLWAARRRLLDQPEENRRLLLSLLLGGVALTALGYAAQAALRPSLRDGTWLTSAAFGIAWQGTTFVQAIAYGAAFALLWILGAKLRSALMWLAPAGRMALTNYLAVSIIGTAFVTATGSYGRAGWTASFALGFALWLAQLLWSRWWLRKFNVGPFEWLWRKAPFTAPGSKLRPKGRTA